jgi:hypothetical protein
MRLQTCGQWWSTLLGPRHIRRTVLGTHIFDLSVSSGRLELKEDDVEDRHRIDRLMIEKSFWHSLVAMYVFSKVGLLFLCSSVLLNASDRSCVS